MSSRPAVVIRVTRNAALAERGLDFADAALVFSGVTLEVENTRKNYGEPRIIDLPVDVIERWKATGPVGKPAWLNA